VIPAGRRRETIYDKKREKLLNNRSKNDQKPMAIHEAVIQLQDKCWGDCQFH